ncbi:hypothetical protein [Curtobacterium sp. UNCCL17]|uniref:hypothetical protein n=1 Tax=Curtobacterium sp. UNCCL17 TaxID=1449051 RepID=UPI0012DF4ADB|nr:hypothetical protein [Curtobacterium sp. UNCCL17]
MRYIDVSSIRLPEGWDARASVALGEVAAAYGESGIDAARAVMAQKGPIWSSVAEALRVVSHSKCWYCESYQSRSDMPVDHFRPKNAVFESQGHPGYWWLAYDWTNYRLSCTFCNSRRIDRQRNSSGGKGTHFPLVEEADRVHAPNGDVEEEAPILLDPAAPGDSGLLYFDSLGKVVPHPRAAPVGSIAEERAASSIQLLHLNHQGITEQRKKLNGELGRALKQAARNLSEFQAGSPKSVSDFDPAMLTLRNALLESAPLSASARAFLRGRRADSEEVATVLDMLFV